MDENVLQNRRRIGRELGEKRTEQGWSREQVAQMVGMKPSTIEKIEAGDFDVKMSQIDKICDVLGCEIAINER